jgi:hypothetical protein
MQQLKRNNTSIKTNNVQLTLHALFLSLNLIPVFTECLPYTWLTDREWEIVDIIYIGIDTIS